MRKRCLPIPEIPPLERPSELATTAEYFNTEAMRARVQLTRANPPEHRVPMPVPLSATGAEMIGHDQLTADADFDHETHHDWLALGRKVDAARYIRDGRRWRSWHPLVPYRCKSEIVIVQTSVDTATMVLAMQGSAALPVGLDSTLNDFTGFLLLLEIGVRRLSGS